MTEEQAKLYPGAKRDDSPGSEELRSDVGRASDFLKASTEKPGMRLLVCGGRDFADQTKLHEALDRANRKRRIGTVIHGAAPGADTIAAKWAQWKGVPTIPFPADWSKGPKAGPERNQRMIDEGRPDGVLAMPGGRGTADLVRRAEAAGIRIWRPFG